jgi:predicted nuclease of predicted toxin-antitoxin system
VRFLVDNQLPRALTRLLIELRHDAVHVLEIEFGQVDDKAIWAYAAEHGYAIISKDADFADLALI